MESSTWSAFPCASCLFPNMICFQNNAMQWRKNNMEKTNLRPRYVKYEKTYPKYIPQKSQGPISKQSKYCKSVSFTEAIMRKCFKKQQTAFFPYKFRISKPTLVRLFPVQLWGYVQINSNHIHWNVCFACMRSLLLWNFLCNLLITGGVYSSFDEIWLHASEGIAILNVEEVHIETKLSAVGLSLVAGRNVSCGFNLKPLMPSSQLQCSLRCQPHCTQILNYKYKKNAITSLHTHTE